MLYHPSALGPLLELVLLATSGRIADLTNAAWFRASGASDFLWAINRNEEGWICKTGRVGFLRTRLGHTAEDERLIAFLIAAQRAALDVSGLPNETAGQFAAALEELQNNVLDHSEAAQTGLIAFRAAPNCFEFGASDRGIGVLQSLRTCSAYSGLSDSGEALRVALSDGASRFGPMTQHGNGFRPIFLGLARRNGSLRFRSGDHAMTIEGRDPALTFAQLSQKAPIDGFLASVRCQPR